MSERGKAYRRHHARRARSRGVRIARLLGLDLFGPGPAIAYSVDRKPCSCWMCGNPRKWFGERTIQEAQCEQRTAFEPLD